MTTIDTSPQWIDAPLGKSSKPAALLYTFTDSAGVAINLTGYTVKMHLRKPDGTASELTGALSDADDGIVTYTLTAANLDQAGYYFAQFWVGNGTNRFDGEMLAWYVPEPLTTTPNI